MIEVSFESLPNERFPGMRARHFLLSLLFLPAAWPSHAQSEPPGGERAQLEARADALLSEATDLRTAADKKRTSDKTACYQRFLVNDCLEKADKEHLAASEEARKRELEGNRIKRDLRARDTAEKAAKAPTEAEQQAEAARRRSEQEAQAQGHADRGGELEAAKASAQARDAAQKQQLRNYETARKQQSAKTAEARRRLEDTKKQTAAYQQAQEKTRQRQAEARAAADKRAAELASKSGKPASQ